LRNWTDGQRGSAVWRARLGRMARFSAAGRGVCLRHRSHRNPKMNLLVIDDHPPVRDGFAHLLRKLDDQLEVDQAGDCAQAMAMAGREYKLILLDMKMPGLNGLDALTAIREAFPSSLVVIVSGEDAHPRVVLQVIERGAVGYIPKSSSTEVMIGALKLVLANGQYIPPTLLGEIAATDAKGLSEQQMEVVRRVARGMQNKEIARELDISDATVKAHLSAAMQKLKARNRTEIVYAAAKLGLKLV
jgi:DNA-binding NarL/FixJ family response regulator